MPDKNTSRGRLAVEAWGAQIGERLHGVVSPLYREGIHRPDPVGSGVMIRVGELVFVVTAAHVLEDMGSGPRYLGALDELLPLPALQFTTRVPPGKTRDKDRLDVGCLLVDSHTAKRFKPADTLTLADLDIENPLSIEAEAFHFLLGYPESRQPRRLVGSEFEARTFPLLTNESSADEYRAIELERAKNLLVHFDKSDTYRSGEKITGPNMPGVSGAPIWRLTGTNGVNPGTPRLAAIAIAWRREPPLGVVGTRIVEWLRLAAQQFPAEFKAEAARLSTARAI